MPFQIPRYTRQLNQFCVATAAFSPEEVDRINDLEDLIKFEKGSVGGPNNKGIVNKKTRDSDVMWVSHDPKSDWLFQKFAHITSMVNYDHFLYDIDWFHDFQYTVYKAKTKQHYDWHIDSGNTYAKFERKISASVMLTDADDYEGGEFQIIVQGDVANPVTIKPQKGDIIYFASWMPHRVQPVTKGVRKSLVCWVMGERHG